MNIKIINKSSHPLPHYETEASAGMDLRADLTEAMTLKPLGRVIVKTMMKNNRFLPLKRVLASA